jgi:hypothetical protein
MVQYHDSSHEAQDHQNSLESPHIEEPSPSTLELPTTGDNTQLTQADPPSSDLPHQSETISTADSVKHETNHPDKSSNDTNNSSRSHSHHSHRRQKAVHYNEFELSLVKAPKLLLDPAQVPPRPLPPLPVKKMPGPSVPKPGPAKLSSHAGLEEWLEEAKLCHYLPEQAMKQLCEMVKECLMEGRFLRRIFVSILC